MPENKPSCAPPLPACPPSVEVEVDRAVRMAVNIRQMGHRILSRTTVSVGVGTYCISIQQNDNLHSRNEIDEV